MSKKVVVFLVLLFGLIQLPTTIQAQTLESFLEHIDLKVGIGKFWDYGWEDKFFFKTGSLSELTEEKLTDWDRVLEHTTWPNLELHYSSYLTDEFDIFFAVKYQRVDINLRDQLTGVISFLNWYKGFDATLNFASVGIGVKAIKWPFEPYIGADIGYCYVSLTTSHIYEMIDTETSTVEETAAFLVDGNGGGHFFKWSLGGSVPLSDNLRVFLEGGYLLATNNWDPIAPDKVQKNTNESYDWFIPLDRQVGRMHGLQVSIGLKVGF